jgi:hypothetical protein
MSAQTSQVSSVDPRPPSEHEQPTALTQIICPPLAGVAEEEDYPAGTGGRAAALGL